MKMIYKQFKIMNQIKKKKVWEVGSKKRNKYLNLIYQRKKDIQIKVFLNKKVWKTKKV